MPEVIPLSEVADRPKAHVKFTLAEVRTGRGSTNVMKLLPWEVPIMQMKHDPQNVTIMDEECWDKAVWPNGFPLPGTEYHRLLKLYPEETPIILGAQLAGQQMLEQLVRANIRPLDDEGNEILLDAPGTVPNQPPEPEPQPQPVIEEEKDEGFPDELRAGRNNLPLKPDLIRVMNLLEIGVDESMKLQDIIDMAMDVFDAEIAEAGGDMEDETIFAKYKRMMELVQAANA